MSESPPPNLEGLLVADRYRVERLIGQGGMGSVWAGRHVTLGQLVVPQALYRAGVLTRQLGFRRIAHGGALDQPDVVAHQILGLHRDGQRHHGVLGQPVEQGEHMIPGGAFRGHMADVRRPP